MNGGHSYVLLPALRVHGSYIASDLILSCLIEAF